MCFWVNVAVCPFSWQICLGKHATQHGIFAQTSKSKSRYLLRIRLITKHNLAYLLRDPLTT